MTKTVEKGEAFVKNYQKLGEVCPVALGTRLSFHHQRDLNLSPSAERK